MNNQMDGNEKFWLICCGIFVTGVVMLSGISSIYLAKKQEYAVRLAAQGMSPVGIHCSLAYNESTDGALCAALTK